LRSDEIKTGTEKAPHRALLKSLGLQDDDMNKPFIGVANSYTNIVPGHIHLRTIGEAVKEGILPQAVHHSNSAPLQSATAVAMGHIGMRYSLPSREIIAD
jgi:dihydroxy-acid dehydratase